MIQIGRKAPEERVDRLHYDQLFAELEPIRRKAARWALDQQDRLGNITAQPPETLHDRAQDLWRPLLAIAELAGHTWMDRARRAAVQLAGIEPPDNSSGVLQSALVFQKILGSFPMRRNASLHCHDRALHLRRTGAGQHRRALQAVRPLEM